MPRAADVGVFVGRFQVHRLHDAHRELIDSVRSSHRNTIVVLGLSHARVTHRNPLDFEARKQMVLEAFPDVTVLYLKDEWSDHVWSQKLDAIIADIATPAQSVVLYGGRDSFIARYHGRYPTQVLEPAAYVSGSELRRSISRSVRGTEDFRAGVIWATANGYPRVFQAVDVAVLRPKSAASLDEMLLVRKPGEHLWRFPGGFVQPTDRGLEQAAKREVAEEAGVEIDALRYVGSAVVDDWRYRQEVDKILTVLFVAEYVHGALQPADDVSEAAWMRYDVDVSCVMDVHRPLLAMLRARAQREEIR